MIDNRTSFSRRVRPNPSAEPRNAGSPPNELARDRLRLWLQMLKSVRHVENEIRERLRLEFDTTLPRFDVLAILDRVPEGLKLGQLSQQLMVSNGNITGIIDALVKEGLVLRVAVENDRRATLVRLTAKGKALMEKMAAAHLSWIDSLLGNIGEAELARAISIMLDIRRAPNPGDKEPRSS